MKNDFLEYYGKHNISPVKQDVSDIKTHFERRKKLYRQCGIPTIAFRNAEILEVGPGGGYNTLAFFQWDSRHIDLVEANPKGREDMRNLFAKQNISEEKYKIFPDRIEDYKTEKKYDIIIAEGFLPETHNHWQIISKLKELVDENGIIVITCSDDVCFFIEIMKRMLGRILSADIEGFDEKVEYLSNIFRPQLAQLRGVSRSAEEWVQDLILNPAVVNGVKMTLMEAIDYFGENFDILGSSPCIFTDYSWYKDIWYDYKNDYRRQFQEKRFSLLMANMEEIILPIEIADDLVIHFKKIKQLEADYENVPDIEKIRTVIEEMNKMQGILQQYFCDGFIKVFMEIKEALLCVLRGETVDIGNYTHFFSAFGRTQQYISFVKK